MSKNKVINFIKLIIIVILSKLSINLIKLHLFEKFCLKCIYIYIDKCKDCPSNIIFRGLKIFDNEKTLKEILKYKKSITRFGDGEFEFMSGCNLPFQKFNKTLAYKLKKVLNSNEKGLLVGINIPYRLKDINKFNDIAKNYYKIWFKLNKFKIAKMINKKKAYYSSTITRFYMDYKNKKDVPNYVKKLKKIWDKRDIVIIEGEKSRLGIGNNLFDNIKSIKRIICPSFNAFNKYDRIINSVVNKVEKKILLLIALGPTATLLSYDLHRLGYQALDVGHIDIEYEWFIRKAKKKIKIENKFVIEVKGNDSYNKVEDKQYVDEIIERID